MGVYNPNMEMPRNCTECIEYKDDCDHYWDYYCTHESRPNDCPLIEINEEVIKSITSLEAVRKAMEKGGS